MTQLGNSNQMLNPEDLTGIRLADQIKRLPVISSGSSIRLDLSSRIIGLLSQSKHPSI